MAEGQRGESADVVVVGGGIMGCCTAYHLQRAGAGRVVLVERAPELATQTTVAAAGFIGLWAVVAEAGNTWRWGAPEVDLERYGRQFYTDLAAEHEIGLKEVGLAWIACGPAQAERQRRQVAQAATIGAGHDVHLLRPAEIHEVAPIVEPAHITSGLYWPAAVQVKAPLAARAVGRALASAGGSVRTNTRVTGIRLQGSHVDGVETPDGVIATRTVVVAAGAWLHSIGQMIGMAFPIMPLLASRFVTAPIHDLPDRLPMLLFQDYYGMYVRGEDGGLLIGAYEQGVSAYRRVSLDAPPVVQELPKTLARFAEARAREFAATIPLLGTIEVTERRSGLPAYTLDGRPLVGALPQVDGLYVVGGDHEAGVTHGPGLGQLLAELIVTGHTSRDITAYRPDRIIAAAEQSAAVL